MTEQSTRKPKKERSPSFPAIDLAAALRRAEQLWDRERDHWAPIPAVLEAWGYTSRSSGGAQTVASLKRYGLLEDRGATQSREARLTEFARAILLDERPESAERDQKIQEAALMPAIHREVWDKYKGSLPSDSTLKYYLTVERGFSPGGAADFLKQFHRTVDFARLTSESGSMSADTADSESEYKERATVAARTSVGAVESHGPGGTQYTGERRGIIRPSRVTLPTPPTVAMIDIPIPVRPGVIASFAVPAQMTDEEWDHLMTVVNAYRTVMARTVRLTDDIGPVSDGPREQELGPDEI